MQYFKLVQSVNSSEIGIFDQVQKLQTGPNSLESQVYYNLPLEGELESGKRFPLVYLEPRAKWTDFLNVVFSAGNFLLVSPRALASMKKFEMDEYQVYEVEVLQGNESRHYHLLRFPWSRNRDYVDWERSIFGHTTQFGQSLIKTVQFSNYDEFYSYKKPLFQKKERLGVEALFLKDNMVKKDIFRLLFISSGVFVSERLKASFEKEGITGCRFLSLSDLSEGLNRVANPIPYQ